MFQKRLISIEEVKEARGGREMCDMLPSLALFPVVLNFNLNLPSTLPELVRHSDAD